MLCDSVEVQHVVVCYISLCSDRDIVFAVSNNCQKYFIEFVCGVADRPWIVDLPYNEVDSHGCQWSPS